MSFNHSGHAIVILTRPEGRADNLKSKLNQENILVVNIPCLSIEYIEYIEYININLNFNKFIFTSINAVDGFFKLAKKNPELDLFIKQINTNKKTVFAIGAATAERLKQYNINKVIYPLLDSNENSEDFIKLEALQNISADHIALIRGDKSREFISASLADRCASLTELIVYKTHCPEGVISLNLINQLALVAPVAPVNRPVVKLNSNFIVLITSVSILENFYNKLDSDLKKTMLDAKIIVPSQRILIYARDLGFKNIYCSNSMNEKVILDMIKDINI